MEEKSGRMGGHGEHGRRPVLASSPHVPVKVYKSVGHQPAAYLLRVHTVL